MNRFYGFYIESKFLEGDGRNLNPTQLGIAVKLFELCYHNTIKSKWGLLVDENGLPLTERKIRWYLGIGSYLPHKTWNNYKKAFFECNVLKNMTIKGVEYLYSPAFVKMNPYQGLRKRNENIEKDETEEIIDISSDWFLGFDPTNKQVDKELDEWGKICCKWIELTNVPGSKTPRSPFPLTWGLDGKKLAKTQLLMQVERIGIEQALHDMAIAFDYKKMAGGEIKTLTYFIARWMSNDWLSRNIQDDNVVDSVDIELKKTAMLSEEINILIKKGRIKTKQNLFDYFPRADIDILKKIAEGLNLE